VEVTYRRAPWLTGSYHPRQARLAPQQLGPTLGYLVGAGALLLRHLLLALRGGRRADRRVREHLHRHEGRGGALGRQVSLQHRVS
jgi:hypothetical protein